MPGLIIVIGTILVAAGVVAYVGTGMASWTALIPSLFGAIFVVLGVVGRRPARRGAAMIGAAVVAFFGVAGSIGGFGELFALLAGEAVERPVAAVVQSLTALLCILVLAVGGRAIVHRGRKS